MLGYEYDGREFKVRQRQENHPDWEIGQTVAIGLNPERPSDVLTIQGQSNAGFPTLLAIISGMGILFWGMSQIRRHFSARG